MGMSFWGKGVNPSYTQLDEIVLHQILVPFLGDPVGVSTYGLAIHGNIFM